MPSISETQLEAFRNELQKEGSTWYNGALKAVSNFAKRQTHSVSGWTPKGGLSSIGINAGTGSAASQAANRRAQELGLTSIPGYAKALWDKSTRKEVLPAALKQQFNGQKGWERALTVGVPAADLAGELVSEDDPNNPQKGRRLGAAIASTAAGLATGSMPLTGSALVGAGAGALGGAAGHQIDRLRKRKAVQDIHVQAPPNPEDARGSGPPVERNMSPSAMGQAPDWSGG